MNDMVEKHFAVLFTMSFSIRMTMRFCECYSRIMVVIYVIFFCFNNISWMASFPNVSTPRLVKTPFGVDPLFVIHLCDTISTHRADGRYSCTSRIPLICHAVWGH